MAKTKNYNVYGSVDFINRLKEEYDWLGRQSKIVEPGHLVVLALPEKKVTKKSDSKSKQGNREDRGPSRVRKESS